MASLYGMGRVMNQTVHLSVTDTVLDYGFFGLIIIEKCFY